MGINWDSILSKAQAHMDTPKRKREMQEKVKQYMLGFEVITNGKHSVEDAGFKFADVLIRTIHSSGLPADVAVRLEDVDVGKPYELGNGRFGIRVYFYSDLDRSSMSSKKEYYTVNLAKLYNNGVDHVMEPIFEWDETGRLHRSRNVIWGANFAEQAIADFLGNYGTEYNVVDIKDTFDE